MKRKSGNGTSASQYIYLLVYLPIPLFIKVGISGNVWKRVGFISESLPGFVVPVLWVKVPWAFQLEQAIHGWLSFLSVPFMGSGKTEWFWLPAAVVLVPLFALVILAKRIWMFCLTLVLTWLLSGCPQEPITAAHRLIFSH